MTRPVIALLTLVLASTWASAATDPLDSIPAKQHRYFFSFRTAVLPCGYCEMDGKLTGLLSTVHGVRLNKTFSVGAGLGITTAGGLWITPVFGHLKMNLLGKNKKNKLFGELNYGWAFAGSSYFENEFMTETTSCRRYLQPSIGYSIHYHDMRIGVLVGVQAIKLNTRYEYGGYNDGWGFHRTATPTITDYQYEVSRLMVGLSVGWRD
jgi:hypothetical protein